MKRGLLFAVILGVFILEGTLLKWITPAVWQGNVAVSTNFTMVIVIFIGLYLNRYYALLYGLGFGLLHDIVYYGPTMIGTYAFAMGLIGYFSGILTTRPRVNIFYSMFMITTSNFLFQALIYTLYRLFQITRDNPEWVFFHVMLPSVLINLLFALLVYVPLRKWLENMANNVIKED